MLDTSEVSNTFSLIDRHVNELCDSLYFTDWIAQETHYSFDKELKD